MSRDGSGNYTFPSSPGEFKTAVSGTTLTAASWNTLANDIETAITASISKDGQTPCSARIPFAAGTSALAGSTAAVSYSVTGAVNTGFYFPTTQQIGYVISGTEQVRLVDGAFYPITDNDVDLGTSSLGFKDGYFSGDVTAANLPLGKYDATVAPDADNDVDEGYSVGSRWFDVTNDKAYVCLDATDGAAVWADVTASLADGDKGDITVSDSGATWTIDSDATIYSNAREFTKTQNFDATTLTDAATIAWDASANQVTSVTLGGNRTLGAPTNLKDGATYILTVKQDATGSRTLAYNSVFKFPGGTAPTLSTDASAVDILTFISDGTNMYGVSQLDFS